MHKKTQAWLYVSVFLSLALVLLVDIVTPIGRAEFIFFFIPVVLAVYSSRLTFSYEVAFVSSVASIAGYLLSPSSDFTALTAELNRAYSIVTLWVVAYVVSQTVRARLNVERETWIRDGLRKTILATNGELLVEEVVSRGLREAATHLGASIGVIYVTGGDGKKLNLVGGYQFSDDSGSVPKTVTVGEGLVGEVAELKKIKHVAGVDQRDLRISSALTSSKPNHTYIFPVTADNELKGVGELAFTGEPHSAIRDFIERVAEPLGTAIRSAQYKVRLRELLEQAQQQSEELQAQQEELRVVNEELEQQVLMVKSSQTKLESQQAELEQTNQQLEEQAEQLERQKDVLEDRNNDLFNVQRHLQEKAQELERASQYKSEFLANMSHELRTPLNSSLILARLLADNADANLTQEQVDFAETIYSAGNDLLHLINDVLDLSKVEAGHLEIHADHVNVSRVVDSMEKLFGPLAQKKDLQFEIKIKPGTPAELITDRQRLDQVLKNLLSNALKFTSKGSVTLEIESEGREMCFKVIDTGIGILPEQQQIIFEAFRQADGTTNRKFGGTGLGLSISRELSKLLGGKIEVTSSPGNGSTFMLRLPLEFEKPTIAKVREPIAIQPTESETKALRNKTSEPRRATEQIDLGFRDDRGKIENPSRLVLIVEDDPTFARNLYTLAKDMKFSAIVATTAEEGVTLAKEYSPGAVLLDVRLPDHSGLTVLDLLKNDPKTRHIPVHVISSEDFSKTAYQLGAVGYMLKPVKREELISAFSKIEERLSQKVKRVLVVEDDLNQQKALIALVGDDDVKVTAVKSAVDALAQLAEHTFDCMILDLSLPDFGGFELLERLAEVDSKYSYPPVIVYTGKDITAAEEQKLRRFSDSIIIKGARSPERLLNEVTLFLHRVESTMSADRQKILRDLRSRDKTLSERTILVVDDDVRNVFAMTGLLEPKGAKVEIARNGREAVEKVLTNKSIDIVLMDIMMPEMDGFEAMRKIRADGRFKNLPIIAVTAKAMKDDQLQCLEAGANDYLAKPIDTDKLLSLIRIWMPRRSI